MSEDKNTLSVEEASESSAKPLGSDAYIHCFACGSKVSVEGKLPGDDVECKKCETNLTVPNEEVLKKLSSFESFTEIGGEKDASDSSETVPHKIFCKGCNAKLDVTDQPVGARFSCPACGMVLSVPERESADKKESKAKEPSSEKKEKEEVKEPKKDSAAKKKATATLEKLKINCHTCGAKIDVTGEEPFKKVNCPACNTPFQIPKRFSHFLLEERLGENQNFSVYRALDLTLSREVCLKVMSKELSERKDMVDAFLSMAGKVALISDPNIVPIYSSGEYEGQCFLVMQYMSASSLDPYLEKAKGLLPLSSVYRSIRDASKGLDAAYKQGINHNNLSLRNILVDRDGNIKVADFGYSYSLHKIDSESELMTFFNPKYISRELAQGEENGLSGDIYSLGAVFYHLITGVAPFPGSNPKEVIKQRIERKPVSPEKVRSEIPTETSDFIMSMMSEDPSERPSSFAEIIKKLELYLDPDFKSSPSGSAVAASPSMSSSSADVKVASVPGDSSTTVSAGTNTAPADEGEGFKLDPKIIGGAAAAILLIIILLTFNGGGKKPADTDSTAKNTTPKNTKVENTDNQNQGENNGTDNNVTPPDLVDNNTTDPTDVEPVDTVDANSPIIKRGYPVKIAARPLPSGISFRPYTEQVIGYMDLHDGDSYDQEASRIKVLKSIKPYLEKLLTYARYQGKLYVKGRSPIDGEVVGVSVRNLTIKPQDNDATLPLSWNRFENQQFVAFFEYYINMREEQLDDATDDLKTQINKDLASDYFRLAVMSDWYGMPDQLHTYMKRCIELDPALRPQVEALLPSINE